MHETQSVGTKHIDVINNTVQPPQETIRGLRSFCPSIKNSHRMEPRFFLESASILSAHGFGDGMSKGEFLSHSNIQ